MKKVLLAICTVFVLSFAVQAQTADAAKAEKQAKKVAMDKYKQLQNDNIDKALKEVGASAEQAVTFKASLKDFGTQSSEVKKDESIDDKTREQKLEAIMAEKNAKLSEIIGADKYKAFNKIRKEQKVAEAELNPNKG